MIKIAPSILAADFTKMGEEVLSLERGGADYIHCDIMDGVFVPNISFGIKMVNDIKKITKVPLDVHLMIVKPGNYLKRFYEAGADVITIHYEATKEETLDLLKEIQSYGIKSCLSIKPDTPVEVLREYLPYLDMILLMSVYPGFGGQKYIESSTERARAIAEMIKESGRDIDLEIDGGVGPANCRMIKDAGVNVLVAGSSVFKAEDRGKAIKELRELWELKIAKVRFPTAIFFRFSLQLL